MGDFNEIKSNAEKRGGPRLPERSFEDFRRMINTCDFQDLKSVGNKFSWTGKRYTHDVWCCLDRVMANSEWLALFPSAQSEFLPFEGSDHRPLVTNICAVVEQRRSQFMYDKRMFNREGFQDMIIENWNEGFLKCNYDCNFTQNGDTPSKAAWIFRDSRGFFVNAGQSEGEICSTVLEAELQALLISMQQAWIKGYRHVIFEGDNFTATQLVNGNMQNFKVHYWIREISFWKKKFTDATFQWTRRDNNKAADRLARQRIPNHLSSVSYFYVPFSIVTILHEDHSS